MTWNIIKQTNTIAPSIYQSNLTAGNVIAMKLVTEAMKAATLQPRLHRRAQRDPQSRFHFV